MIWLVKQHLTMSDAAQRRDVNDPKTVRDFAAVVQGPERLRLLLLLTVADIRAVGPGTWNGWKGQLLRELYYETEAVLQGGHAGVTYVDRLAQAKAALKERLSDLPRILVETLLERHYPAYWLSLDAATHEKHARMMVEADASGRTLTVESEPNRATGSTEVTVYTPDHPGLFSQLAGAFAMCGASIVDAKIFTTTHGMALDLFTIQDAEGGSFDDEARLQRLSRAIESTLKGEVRAHEVVAGRRPRRRAEAFTVEPAVIIDNTASDAYTVIEVNGRDRPGLLARRHARAFQFESLHRLGAHRDLWRARGRRLLCQGCLRPESGGADRSSSRSRRTCSPPSKASCRSLRASASPSPPSNT